MSQSQVNSETLQAFKAMFLTDGWKMLCEDFQKNVDAFGPTLIGGVPSIEQVYFEKGRAAVWMYVLGLENFIDNVQKLEADRE